MKIIIHQSDCLGCVVCIDVSSITAACAHLDEAVHSAMLRGEPVTAWQPDAAVSKAIAAIWQRVCAVL